MSESPLEWQDDCCVHHYQHRCHSNRLQHQLKSNPQEPAEAGDNSFTEKWALSDVLNLLKVKEHEVWWLHPLSKDHLGLLNLSKHSSKQ